MSYETPPPSIALILYRTLWCAVVVGALIYGITQCGGHTSDIPGECTHPDCMGVR